jgi:hypothetical protein
MMLWHVGVIRLLRESALFTSIQLSGGKVRAFLSETRFLDIHFDPISHSYSYALIDLTLPYPGDKRLFGWDDYPHLGIVELSHLSSAPHHFQQRLPNGSWHFSESAFRGQVEKDVVEVLAVIKSVNI